jgi:NDP-sugar pyrophosphorylase family protein
MDVLVPIAAEDTEFRAAGYEVPKPLIDIRGRPMIEWATACLEGIDSSSYIFPVLESHINEYDIDDRLRGMYGSEIEIVPIDVMTDGAAATALRAAEHLSDEELIVLFGDQYIHAPVRAAIRDADADGLIAIFESSEPRWSYAKTDGDGTVTEVAEKAVISSNATAGLYYFRSGSEFVEAAEQMIQKDIRTNGLFYICPVYNELIEMEKQIEVFPVDEMWSLGTPADVDAFEKKFEGV